MERGVRLEQTDHHSSLLPERSVERHCFSTQIPYITSRLVIVHISGKFAVVGTYDGRVIFFSTDQLKYHTTIHVRQSGRGKGTGKVTGIEPVPGEDKILITSNDSRIRLYDLRDLSLVCKYKGYTNLSSQIKACISPDGRYICAGSENQCVFLWRTAHVPQVFRFVFLPDICSNVAIITIFCWCRPSRLERTVITTTRRSRRTARW